MRMLILQPRVNLILLLSVSLVTLSSESAPGLFWHSLPHQGEVRERLSEGECAVIMCPSSIVTVAEKS